MNSILIAAIYGLVGGLVGNLLAGVVALTTGRQARSRAIGVALGGSGGFILGAAFFDLIDEARALARADVVVGLGVAAGLLFMIGLGAVLGAVGLGGENPDPAGASPTRAGSTARVIAIGEGIHNIPEALPIGAALAISPHLSLLIALLMTVENFAEAGAIASVLLVEGASASRLLWETTWPGLLSVIGAPLGVVLASISPVVLAFTLALAAGIMLFIAGDVWGDSQREAGPAWSAIGLLAGVLLALATSGTGPG